MKKTLAVAVLSALFTITMVARATADLTFMANVRDGGATVLIHAEVRDNKAMAGRPGRTVTMLHGMNHAGNVWRPLAEEIFTDPRLDLEEVSRVIIVNLPGRGGSGLPNGFLFGDLNIDDYARIVKETLLECRRDGISPTEIIAHSMGGLVVQVLQERLLSETIPLSLKSAFDIDEVKGIGIASPSGVEDPILESGVGLYLLSLYTRHNLALGNFVRVSPDVFVGLFFSDKNGNPVAGTPTPKEVVKLGYKSDEAFAAALQTVGTAEMRPHVRRGAFSSVNGTRLKLIVGSQDPFNDIEQQRVLYRYLTEDVSDRGLRLITADDAVHDQFVIDPATVWQALSEPDVN